VIVVRPAALATATRKRARTGVRRLTSSLRALPDFVIIGTQKGGTSSLYQYLRAHPDVLSTVKKEVHYFSRYVGAGEEWYRSNFPLLVELSALQAVRGRRPLVGESSPSYLFHPLVGERMRDLLPDVRLIVLLRDPVERAFSHYRHKVRQGRESLSFADAIAAEPERLGAHEGFEHRDVFEFSYVTRGRYAEQLQRWFAAFPRERFLILRSEDLYEHPAEAYRRTLDFLELEPAGLPRFEVHNRGIAMPMDPAVRRALIDVFAAPNQHLYQLLGADLGWQH
jgi:hypothetical protein